MKFNYNITYSRPVDSEWVSRQFKIYDQYVREHYDPRELLNNFDGTSYDNSGFEEYNIIHLGNLVSLSVAGDSSLSGNLLAKKNVTINGTLTVKEDSTFNKNVTIKNLLKTNSIEVNNVGWTLCSDNSISSMI